MAGCQKDELIEETIPTPTDPSTTSNEVAGKFIVVLKDGEANNAKTVRERVLGAHGIGRERVKDVFDGVNDGFTGNLTAEQVELLRNDENVAHIEPEQAVLLGKPSKNSISTSSTTTTTTSTTSTQVIPWGVARVGYGDGTGKTVWVIDSGVDSKHPDLNVDVARSKSFISGVTSFEDEYGHGTGVAGIIGAKNNNIGVIGVAANATIVALRVFDKNGAGTLTRIYSALNHVYKNGKPGDVVNMSLRVDGSILLDDMVRKTAARGIFIAVASGNSYVDCKNDSPARVVASNVFVVSNMTETGSFNLTSNFGQSVNFAAPGSNIRTTWKGSSYATGNGTSYAAPHVAGILALNSGKVNAQGTVVGDPDGKPDAIALR